jgi:tungstate transport system permease protein
MATIFGVPIGFLVGIKRFRGRSGLLTVMNTFMALPTVVIGLLAYGLFSRRAPLGFLDLLFTPGAVIIGEFILSLPIIANLTVSAVQAVDSRAILTAKSLGAGKAMVTWTILMEARFSLLTAIIAGFGRAVSEVGSAMMLGGNIRFFTRTMTTTIALETSKGEFGFGLALGFFLLLVVFSLNILFQSLQVKGRRL